jgi:hypothetical protein
LIFKDSTGNWNHSKFLKIPDELPKNDKLIFKQIDFLESMHQITIVPFEVRDFEWKLKEQVLALLRDSENTKLPYMMF